MMLLHVVIIFFVAFASKYFCNNAQDPPAPTSPPIQYTQYFPRDLTFFGNVRCADGRPIGDNAYVSLSKNDSVMIKDNIANDRIYADPDPIESGIFQVNVRKGLSFPPNSTELLFLYLEFSDICYDGQYKTSGFLKHNYWVEYIIDDNEPYAIAEEPPEL